MSDLFSLAESPRRVNELRIETFKPATPRAPARTKLLGHDCAVAGCAAEAGWGFGVCLRKGQEGRWACNEHRALVEAMK